MTLDITKVREDINRLVEFVLLTQGNVS